MVTDAPTLVRLVLATDWDAGFLLASSQQPLGDVLPGDEYVSECVPQRSVVISEVVVRDFQLVQISVGEKRVKWHLEHYVSETDESETYIEPIEWAGDKERRRYRLEPPLAVLADEHVHVRLKNDLGWSLKPKVATLVRDTLVAQT